MTWSRLLFMHWPVPIDVLRPHVPPMLDIDTFDGSAWLGVVPFTMTGVRARWTPALPGPGAFHELNVRTYVTHRDKPGVWFFSLDAARRLAVEVARSTFRLAYFTARMSLEEHDGRIEYA
ncbi:MAG: YqjF family protein, partial [Phycisphaerales bacterium JB060]